MDNREDNINSFQLRQSRADVLPTTMLENSTNSERSGWNVYHVCVTIMDLINHALIAIVTVFLLYYSLRSLTETHIHVALCSVGYVLLMSEAILILAGEDILTNFLTRRAKCYIHICLQLLGLICSIAGVWIMYQAKTVHFRSIHAITGITSLVIMCFLAIFGYPVFIAMKLRKFIRPVVVKFLHNFLGISCFVIGIVSQCYGYQKVWFVRATDSIEHIALICTTLTVLITIFSVRGALPSLYSQARAILK